MAMYFVTRVCEVAMVMSFVNRGCGVAMGLYFFTRVCETAKVMCPLLGFVELLWRCVLC